ncbi:hypothetical protein H9Q10_01140 [Eikenella sp. S3360]|uniref:Uncharacterized protein n=1 Tax=Eikenella glucosivorans TaxID=2766967 RepID=A0ABS0N7J0_9NEIS|nr:hypothetical protein [Eikenella glucosivorans]MBH5328278.1 hypothetical protein [Eikenella glucosivorans]
MAAHLNTLPAPRPLWRALLPTLLAGGFVGWFAGQPGYGFSLELFLPLLVLSRLWFTAKALRVSRRELRRQLAICGLWLILLGGLAVLHKHYAHLARVEADHLLAQILAKQQPNGSFAPMPFTTSPRWRILYGVSDKGKPILHYRDTYNVFNAQIYDFEQHRWQYFID